MCACAGNKLETQSSEVLSKHPGAIIKGIEVTQVVQHYRPLVAGKTTGVRVYAQLSPAQRADFAKKNTRPYFKATIFVNGSASQTLVKAIPSRQSLNFVIPAAESIGEMTIEAHVDVTDASGARTFMSETSATKISFVRVPPIQMVEVRIKDAVSGAVAPEGLLRRTIDNLGRWILPVGDNDIYIRSIELTIPDTPIMSLRDYTTSSCPNSGNTTCRPLAKEVRTLLGTDEHAVIVIPGSVGDIGIATSEHHISAVHYASNDRNLMHEIGHGLCGLQHPARKATGELNYRPLTERVFPPHSNELMNGRNGSAGETISPYNYNLLLKCFLNESWKTNLCATREQPSRCLH